VRKILCPIVSTAVCFGSHTVADYRSAIVGLCLRRKEQPSAFSLAAGRLDKALDAAATNKWVVVDMKNDWKRIFPFE
jgi:hypothetical protein